MSKKTTDLLKETLIKTIKKIESGDIDIEEAKGIVSSSNAICKVVNTDIAVNSYNERIKDKSKKVKF